MKKLPYDHLLCPRSREADVRAFDAMCARKATLAPTPLLRLLRSPGAVEARRASEPFDLLEVG